VSAKLDWSGVASKVSSRLEEHYIPPAKGPKGSRPSAAKPAAAHAPKGGGGGSGRGGAAGLRGSSGGGGGGGGASQRQDVFMASDLPPLAAMPRGLARSRSEGGRALGYELVRPARPHSQGTRQRLSSGHEQQQHRSSSSSSTRSPPLVTDRRTEAAAAGARTPRGQPIRAPPGGAPTSPLDDLLQHVNSLIDEFDNKLKKRSDVF
jgi:hypothetical protein